MFLLWTLWTQKYPSPHCLHHGKSDRVRGHLRVAFTESFQKVLSHLVFLIQQSLWADVFSRSLTDGDLSSYCSQLQFIVSLLSAEFYLLSCCLPRIIVETQHSSCHVPNTEQVTGTQTSQAKAPIWFCWFTTSYSWSNPSDPMKDCCSGLIFITGQLFPKDIRRKGLKGKDFF